MTTTEQEVDPLYTLYIERVTGVLDNLQEQVVLAEIAQNQTSESNERKMLKALESVKAVETVELDNEADQDELDGWLELVESIHTAITAQIATHEVNRDLGDKLAKTVQMNVDQTIMFDLPESVTERATELIARWGQSAPKKSNGAGGTRRASGQGTGTLVQMHCKRCDWHNLDSTSPNSAFDRAIAKHAAKQHADVMPVRPFKGDKDWQAAHDAIDAIYKGESSATAELSNGLVFVFSHGGNNQ